MENIFAMGNEAIAMGAIHAGAHLVSGYPGTPSTEVLEYVAGHKPDHMYVEWSVNEKAALEVAAGAAYAGAWCMVTMKQVGLNVAADPLMSLVYVGIQGALVLVVADDPGPISSQTEQDTRHFARFAKLPVFDPSTPEEAYAMTREAFRFSHQHKTPVILRPTTRVCHGCASFVPGEPSAPVPVPGFSKSDGRWVIFPRLSYANHLKIEENLPKMGAQLGAGGFNSISGCGRRGIASGGVSHAYLMEALCACPAQAQVFKVGTPHPFAQDMALEFLRGVDEVLVIEELDPVIERELIYLCGLHHLPVKILGKLSGHMPCAGENTPSLVNDAVNRFLGVKSASLPVVGDVPPLPVRPPVLCAGCPHRASFYAVKQAFKGQNAVFTGDIGCYTLGNAQPLDMVDTCLCMGAGITVAQGLYRVEPGVQHVAFVGDSTFFASGLTGVANAVYNRADMLLVVLDNATTAMTGQQPHPGTGVTAPGGSGVKMDIEGILSAMGVDYLATCNPFDHDEAVAAVKKASCQSGVRVLVFRAPCIARAQKQPACAVGENCIGCRRCVNELGCPAITWSGEGVAAVDAALCTGCGLCAQICPVGAIGGGGHAV